MIGKKFLQKNGLNSMPTITIDPKIFINKPYIKCPNCGKKSFGVLSIYSYHYARRCFECRYEKSFKLPPIPKKIIYLDQFVISEMMKSINPKLNKTNKVDPFFRVLFEKLDRLNKLQVIVCPESTIHFDESVVSTYYPALKRMYEQLAHNFTFYDPETIKRFQIIEDFKGWIGQPKKIIDIGTILMGNGDLDGWQSRLYISVDLRSQNPTLANDLRRLRDQGSELVNKVFQRWQTEKTKKFNDWYEEERYAYGPAMIRSYLKSLFEFNAIATGKIPLTINNIGGLTSNVSVIMTIIHRKLRELGFSDEEGVKKSIEYFQSESIKNIPYIKLSSMLFAALAVETKFGRKKPPSRGIMNDVEIIASYSPYCDAMLIDKECQRLLKRGLKETKNTLQTKIFSQNDKVEFIEYLDQIEKSTSKKHLMKVKEVYGNTWLDPYIEMFQN